MPAPPPPPTLPRRPPTGRPRHGPLRHAPNPAVPYHFPKWIIVGAAGLLLLILGLNLRRPVAADPPPAITPATTTVPAPLKSPDPEPVAPRQPKPSPVAGKPVWRVIAFTYHTHDAAAKKVRQLNEFHPDLHATVFPLKSKRDYSSSLSAAP